MAPPLMLADALTPDSWPEMVIRMSVALGLGALCGWDRERGGQAAGLWVIAAVGIACGAGMYVLASTAAGGVLLVLVVMRYVERRAVGRR